MFTITATELLLIDPILSAKLRMKAKDLAEKDKNIKSDYWIVVEENDKHDVFVTADNGYDITDSIQCSLETKIKLLNLNENKLKSSVRGSYVSGL